VCLPLIVVSSFVLEKDLPGHLTPFIQLPANVDWALLNFMADWFPVESREKLRYNQREANAELAGELGFDKNM
jgi:hypothetical protein